MLALAAAALGGWLPMPVRAGHAEEASPGWQRTFKGVQDGAPSSILALAQSPDGFIWVGAVDGLYRYDGRTFERVPSSGARPTHSDTVRGLLPLPDGDVWGAYDWGGLSRIHGGKDTADASHAVSTASYLVGAGGKTWWSVGDGMKQLKVVRGDAQGWAPWVAVPDTTPSGTASDVAAGADGLLWILSDDRLVVVSPDRPVFERVDTGPVDDASLAVDGSGQPWLVLRHGIRRLSRGAAGQGLGVAGPTLPRPATRQGGKVVFDGVDGFWAVEDDNVLRRYDFDAAKGATAGQTVWKSPYRLPNPAFGQHNLPLLVDREHNLWVGTSLGLEKFSRSLFTTLVKAPAGSSQENAIPFFGQDGHGDVWIHGGGDLFKVDDGGNLVRQPVRLPTEFTPCTSPHGGVWIPDGHGRLTLFGGGGAARSVALSGTGYVESVPWGHCAEDAQGRVWSTELSGMVRLGSGRAEPVDLANDAGYGVQNLVADNRGNVLAYVGRGSLWRVGGLAGERLWDENAIALGFIEVLYQTPAYLLMGGDRGLVRHDGHRFELLSRDRLPALASTSGIVQTPKGETWLQTSKGVVVIPTAELERAFADPGFTPHLKTYGMADGLPGPATALNMSNITADRQGRIYVATTNGIARYDPARSAANTVVPPVAILGAQAGDTRFAAGEPIAIKPGADRVRFDFTALSFVDPDRVRFRYRLAGLDADWVDAGPERSAVYTGLPPGSYRFQVIAANESGVWNLRGASTEVVVGAHFYEERWFHLACASLAALALLAGYRWRLAQVSRRVRNQAIQRAQERERIARDLHDTLLQSVQGLLFRFQSVAKRMAPTDPNRAHLERTLDRADEVIAEGKARVQGLRNPHVPTDLLDAIERLVEDAPFQTDVAKSFLLRGAARAIDPAAMAEIREIVSEAVFNAARHAKARRVSAEVHFTARALDVFIADDGIGLTKDAVAGPRQGSFGLVGMRERAAAIGGTLTLGAAPEGGTVVRLSVPGRAAYSKESRSPWRRLWAAVRDRRRDTNVSYPAWSQA